MRWSFLGSIYPLYLNALEQSTQWDANWDGLESLKDSTKVRRHIVLVRHGQYCHNKDIPIEQVLTKLGRQQAQMTGLRMLECRLQFDRVIQSDLIRAKQTAAIIAPIINAKKIDTDPDLNEGFPCVPDPCFSNSLKDRGNDSYHRIERAFKRYFHRPTGDQNRTTYDLIVCHANVIRYFVCRALQLPGDAWLRFSVNHGSYVWITILSDGRVILRQYSNCGYMPMSLISK
ncbi:hypothetical protein GJ496_010731 [Pomphorhynchus laevis]|nr:hypothetical protein GJ496_010731 [Pomphorhynchus laevis]